MKDGFQKREVYLVGDGTRFHHADLFDRLEDAVDEAMGRLTQQRDAQPPPFNPPPVLIVQAYHCVLAGK